LIAHPLQAWGPGLGLILLGLLLHAAGFAFQQPRVSIIGLFVGLYGLTGTAWGPRWLRASFFPFILFAFMVPLGTQALPITFHLRMLVSKIVEGISHNVLTIEIVRQGTQLIDPSGRYKYEVAAACSGIRSLITTLLLAIVYGSFAFRSWWRWGLMIAAAFPLAVLGNVLRLLTIVIAAELFGQKAGSWAHENFVLSLFPYVPMFLGLMGIAHWLREPRRETVRAAGTDFESSSLPTGEAEQNATKPALI
jgi:exosortase